MRSGSSIRPRSSRPRNGPTSTPGTASFTSCDRSGMPDSPVPGPSRRQLEAAGLPRCHGRRRWRVARSCKPPWPRTVPRSTWSATVGRLSRPTRRRAARGPWLYSLELSPMGRWRGAGPPSSSGLGRRPFKAEARVRIPLGARHQHICARRGVRSSSPPCQGGDRGIEARRARWASESETARSPISGEVAQLVEHAAENRGVGGPIPPLPTPLSYRPSLGRNEP